MNVTLLMSITGMGFVRSTEPQSESTLQKVRGPFSWVGIEFHCSTFRIDARQSYTRPT